MRSMIPAAAVLLLTRDRNISYAAYIDGLIASGNRDALLVKQADLKHNMDESRTTEGFLPKSLMRRYVSAAAKVEAALLP